MKVIILGAGASKAYTQSKTGIKMPIANDFFKTYRQLSISENLWVLVGNFINYLRDYHNLPTDSFEKFNKDIEEIHSEIEEKLRITIENYDQSDIKAFANSNLFFKAYSELIFLFTNVINEIQNGEVSKIHLELASLLKEDDVIVSFNWDTLMDKALSKTTQWIPEKGYYVNPVAVYRDGWEDVTDNTESNFPILLKLHGSTNWLTGAPILEEGKMTSIQEVPLNNFFVYEYTVNPYSTYKGRYMGGYESYSYGYYPPNLPLKGKPLPKGWLSMSFSVSSPLTPEGKAPSDGLVSIPLIIPPVKQKSYSAFGDLLIKIWKKAEQAISKASEIIIIGYSFPKTDIQTDELFKKAFIQRTDIPNITIVNPDPENIKERFIYNYGIPESNLTIIKDYFSESFDVKKLLS